MNQKEFEHEYLSTPPASMEIECCKHGKSPAFENRNGEVFCYLCWERALQDYEARRKNGGAYVGADYGYPDRGTLYAFLRGRR